MKKLINKPEDVVTEALQGMAAAHPDLIKVTFGPNYVVRADAPVQGKVALVSGGGSALLPSRSCSRTSTHSCLPATERGSTWRFSR